MIFWVRQHKALWVWVDHLDVVHGVAARINGRWIGTPVGGPALPSCDDRLGAQSAVEEWGELGCGA